MTGLEKAVRDRIRDIPDFPKKGIVFKDITPLLKDARVLKRVVTAMAKVARKQRARVVAGIESRGFMFGALLADRLGLGFIPIRKKGKLPWKTWRQGYALEYGRDAVEMHRDAVAWNERVFIVDDVLATGGTLAAACKLVEKAGGRVAGTGCVIELSFLDGRRRLGEWNFTSIASC